VLGCERFFWEFTGVLRSISFSWTDCSSGLEIFWVAECVDAWRGVASVSLYFVENPRKTNVILIADALNAHVMQKKSTRLSRVECRVIYILYRCCIHGLAESLAAS
jgi:hypothetical protein